MTSRKEALDTIIALAREHELDVQDIAAALKPGDADRGSSTSRILAWVGGIFILCGLGFFIETFWADMNAAARIILYLGAGLVMLVVALVFIENAHYEKSILPLFLLAALFQSGAIIYLSTLVRSRMLLFTGTCAMIGYLGWFTSEYFADSIGWPLVLIIIGVVFIGFSVFAVKISRDYITGSP